MDALEEYDMELLGAISEEGGISRNRIAGAEKRFAAIYSGRQNRPIGNRNLSCPDSDCPELNSRGLQHLSWNWVCLSCCRVQSLETPSFYFPFSFHSISVLVLLVWFLSGRSLWIRRLWIRKTVSMSGNLLRFKLHFLALFSFLM